MARYKPNKNDPPPLTRDELRRLWVEYPCPTMRRLLLEIKRRRKRTADAYGFTMLLLDRENWQTVDRARINRSIDEFVQELYAEPAVRETRRR